MADSVVSDAELATVDEGVGSIADGNERTYSAGWLAVIAMAFAHGGYRHNGLTFTGHDGANDQVDVTSGLAFLMVSTVDVQSAVGSTGSTPSYDLTLGFDVPIPVYLPTNKTNLAVQDSTLSAVWLAIDTDGTGPGGTAGDVYIRTDDTGSVTAPSHPSLKLGEANPDDATADVNLNDAPLISPLHGQQYVETVTALSGTTPTIDLSSANLFTHTLTGNTTYSFSNPSTDPKGNSFTLLITQDGSTQYTLSWPNSVEWDNGSAPADPATGEDLEVAFVSYDGGSTWKGRKTAGSFA